MTEHSSRHSTQPDVSSLFDITDRVVIVTGAGRGIGRAISLALGQLGAKVIPSDINLESARETQAGLSPDRSLALRLDVTDPTSIGKVMEDVTAAFGRIDVLVNNAGINDGNGTPPLDLEFEIWNRVVATNLTGSFLCSQAAAQVMKEHGSGKIINVASSAGVIIPRLSDRYPVAYSTTKAGVIMLTRSLALFLAEYGINVNAISPTYTDTGLIQRDEVRMQQMLATSPFGRLGQPSDLIGTVVFLASRASDWVTGQNLLVDGGYSL